MEGDLENSTEQGGLLVPLPLMRWHVGHSQDQIDRKWDFKAVV